MSKVVDMTVSLPSHNKVLGIESSMLYRKILFTVQTTYRCEDFSCNNM